MLSYRMNDSIKASQTALKILIHLNPLTYFLQLAMTSNHLTSKLLALAKYDFYMPLYKLIVLTTARIMNV